MKHYNNNQLKNFQQHSNMNTWSTKSIPNPFISISGYILKGKHKGKKVSEVSTSYLEWVNNNIELSVNEQNILRENI